MASSHSTIPTPSPRERSLIVNVEESVFANDPDILPTPGTLYKDCEKALFAQDYRKKFENYSYREQVGDYGLLFVKTKTPTERNTPVKEYSIKEPYGWLPVLTFLEFTQDRGAPLSQNTLDASGNEGTVIIPRWLVRRGYIHGQQINTTIHIREFLSEVDWPDELVPADEPLGTEVSWDLTGSHGSTGRCLHKEEKVPGQRGPYAVISNDGQQQSASSTGQTSDQYFARTNALKWVDFTTNVVKRVNGQNHRIEYTYIAPVMPKASIIT